uniref:glycosyltransferase n=1 Tax=Acidocella sp. C78 TaxID=1671486 RepID=UPI00191BA1A2
MKILYLNLDRGIPVEGDKGASVHVREFVAAAASLGHEVTLACTTRGAGNPPPPARLLEFAPPPADMAIIDPIERRERVRIEHDWSVGDRVLAALASHGIAPDLVYERHALFHRAGVCIATRLGVPRLLEVNAPLVEEQRRFRGLCLVDEALAAEAESYRGADAIIAVSRQVAAHVAAVLGRADRVHVVPNGVDLARFADVDPAGQALRARLGLGGRRIAGFVGSFKAWHG